MKVFTDTIMNEHVRHLSMKIERQHCSFLGHLIKLCCQINLLVKTHFGINTRLIFCGNSTGENKADQEQGTSIWQKISWSLVVLLHHIDRLTN
jgi:hypothetical protein